MEPRPRPAGFIDMRIVPILAFLLLAACRGGSPGHDNGTGRAESDAQPAPTPDHRAESAARTARPPTHADRSPAIPVALQGRWTGVRDDCADRAAVLELDIARRQLVFHESVGTVTAVAPHGDGGLAVRADFTGEGSSWNARLVLRASADGRRLTITDDRGVVIRKRCDAV